MPRCTCTRITHLSAIASPCHMSREKALLNITYILEGYHLLREVLDEMNVTYRKNEKKQRQDQWQSIPP